MSEVLSGQELKAMDAYWRAATSCNRPRGIRNDLDLKALLASVENSGQNTRILCQSADPWTG